MSRTLLVWDIDGTLLQARGTGRQALNLAFFDLFGISQGFDGLDFSGGTDHDLWQQALDRHHILSYAALWREFHLRYTGHLQSILTTMPLVPLPGVVSLIVALSLAGWPLALGTGNCRAGAYLKLGAVGLANYFPAGGFSVPHSTRADLLAQGTSAATKLYRLQTPAVIVIGDTPRDVAAAHQNGYRALGVATGHFSAGHLTRMGADAVLSDLSKFDLVIQTLRQLQRN